MNQLQQRTETHAYAHPDEVSSNSSTSSLSLAKQAAIIAEQNLDGGKAYEAMSHEVEPTDGVIISIHDESTLADARKRKKKSKKIGRPTGRVVLEYDKECRDIEDYYKKYEPLKAKTMIDELSVPRQVICTKCAKFEESPVYSDRFVYKRQPLYAREILSLSMNKHDGEAPKPLANRGDNIDFMPIYKLTKSNVSGIFYNVGMASDVCDTKPSLEPSIVLLETRNNFRGLDDKSAQINNRFLDRAYSRVSEKCIVEAIIPPPVLEKKRENFKVNLDYDANSAQRSWIVEELNRREDVNDDLEQNRSSLLMLEPLLLMSSETASRRQICEKKRLAREEHLKLIRIVIAYTLTFFLLVSITFYVVYFT